MNKFEMGISGDKKNIFIYEQAEEGRGLNISIDSDDVDRPVIIEKAKKLLKLLNENF